MAKREMIVAGYIGDRAEEQVDPFLRGLIGKFTDDLNEQEKALLEYTQIAMLPDLYWAYYDTETFALVAASDSESGEVSVSFGREPDSPFRWKQLRFAFNAAISLAMEIE